MPGLVAGTPDGRDGHTRRYRSTTGSRCPEPGLGLWPRHLLEMPARPGLLRSLAEQEHPAATEWGRGVLPECAAVKRSLARVHGKPTSIPGLGELATGIH